MHAFQCFSVFITDALKSQTGNNVKLPPVPCCKQPFPLNLLKKLLAKKTNNSGNATQFIVELNNTMAIRYVGNKATSKISLANMTFISDVNATISGIRELCLKSGIPSTFCKLKKITQTQAQTFGNISEILKIANGSNTKQISKLKGMTEIIVPSNLSALKIPSSDVSVENTKNSNDQGTKHAQLYIVFITCFLYMRKRLLFCHQDTFALVVPSCRQVRNKMLSPCNKVDEANKLFQ